MSANAIVLRALALPFSKLSHCVVPGTERALWLSRPVDRVYILGMQKRTMRALGCLALLSAFSGCNDSSDTGESADPVAAACELDWKVANVAPCIAAPTLELPPLIYSSHLNSAGVAECEPYGGFPQPVPADPWSEQSVIADATGDARLCVALKQGVAQEASDDDCTLFEQCTDVSYTESGEKVSIPPLMAWAASDEACSRKYYAEGGYLELRIESDALGCDDANDVTRYQFCPLDCDPNGDASREECKNCRPATSITGTF